jgi:hypothetical protein
VGFFKDSIRILGLDMDSLAEEAGRPLERGNNRGKLSDVDRIRNARAIGGRRVVRDGGFIFISGQRVRREGPYTYVGNDRIRTENGITFIGDKQLTREGGFLYLDGQRVEE